MNIVYTHDLNSGTRQIMRTDDSDTLEFVKESSIAFGYVAIEFRIEQSGVVIDVIALTPDTLLQAERERIEKEIIENHWLLKDGARIHL